MQIFNSGFFWFLEGILFMVMILGLRAWAQEKHLRIQLWKWVLFTGWLFLAGFTVAFVGTSLGEGEPVAATRGGLLFGLVTIIAGVGVWRILLSGRGSEGERAGSGA